MLRGFVGGRGTGKSFVGAYDLLKRAKPNRTYMVVAPTYPMLRDAALKTFMELGQRFHYLSLFRRSDMYAKLGNGAMVLFRSADNPDRLRGSNLSGVWLDEAGEMSREAFDVVLACLREGGERGWLSATFTPRGRTHWTYDVFGRRHDGAELFRASTADNPFLPLGFYDSVKAQYSGSRAKQELGGEFVEMEGAAWSSDSFGEWIWCPQAQWPGHFSGGVLSLDPSTGKDLKRGDYCAITHVGWRDDGLLYVDADLDRVTIEGIVPKLLAMHERYNPNIIRIEANGFQHALKTLFDAECLRRYGRPLPVQLVTNKQNKEERITRLSPYITNRQFRFRERVIGCELLVDQLREFPKGEHDDGPDALEMAVRTE